MTMLWPLALSAAVAASPAPPSLLRQASSPALQALERGDLEGAIRSAAPGTEESKYVRAKVALSRADHAEAERLLAELAAGTRERAEVAWYLAHARRNGRQIASAAQAMCRIGDPTGRACVDAELYARAAPAPSVELDSPRSIRVAKSVPIPLTLADAGEERTGFVIDSGASETVISSQLAKKLGLWTTVRGFPVAVAGGGGVSLARMAILPRLSIGGVVVRNLRVLVMDLAELEQSKISGILSPQQAFHGLTVSFDFARHLVSVRRGPESPAPGGITVPYVHAGFDLAVPARVGNGPPALFGIDTGMAGECTVAADYLPTLTPAGRVELKGAGASAVAQMLPALPVVVGGITLRREGRCSRTPMVKAGIRLAGLLGNELWKGGTLTLDTVARTVSLAVPDSLASNER
ncbi:MAG: retroviral-like aspartic protease family protein [Myxococcales bacterium]|nr:retroviral-like aspartic protease family protein [Myxococcales bacterium]